MTLKNNLRNPQKERFMSTAARAAEQVEIWQHVMYRSLEQHSLMIEQMLDPTYFDQDLSNYPLNWDSVNAMNWN